MIRVLHSVLSLEIGGLENGVVNLLNNMPDDMQVDVLCLRARGDLVEKVKHPRARVIFSDSMDDHSIRSALKAHLTVLNTNSYDIVHTHGWTTLLSGAFASWFMRVKCLSKLPLIINGEHGVYYADHWRRRLAQKWLFSAIDGNLSVSADLGKRMEQSFNLKTQFHPILNGVDTQHFRPKPEVRALQRANLGFTSRHIVVGTVGRLVAIKNYPLLINSFHQLFKSNSNLRLVFCGDGAERFQLEALVDQLGLADAVIFAGRINNVQDVMQAFDVFALSSDMEGLPNTLLEAMASGIPSMVTDVGGSREVMCPGAGVLVPPGNSVAFANALQELVGSSDARAAMAERALKHVREAFTLQSMADQYYNYYRKLLS